MDRRVNVPKDMRAAVLLGCCVLSSVGCFSKVPAPTNAGGGANTTSTGTAASAGAPAKIDSNGSSTVYPISQAVAEAWRAQAEWSEVDVSVGYAGTGGGFDKFILKEIDICNASRAIKDAEKQRCAESGVEYVELEVAIDGLTVVVNPANTWVDCLTVAQLKQIWEPNSKVMKWSDVNPAWPDEKLQLFGADSDSGTFDYFTEAINGKSKQSRTDYTPSSNDNVLVQGVASEKNALGYFGYGYYVENQQRLKALGVKNGDDAACVVPSEATIDAGEYVPLSRPLFVYVNKASLKRPEVAGYLRFYLSEEGQKAVVERKFLRLKPDVLKAMQQRLDEALAAK
jgi:phosphate transport system substrate-binding protein